MKTIFLKTIILVLTMSFIGCNKEEENKSEENETYMSFTFDGNNYATNNCIYLIDNIDNKLYITGFFDIDNDDILDINLGIIIPGNPDIPGTYNLDQDNIAMNLNFLTTPPSVYNADNVHGGDALVVLKEKSTTVKGTFSFTGVSLEDSSVTKTISNGKFNAMHTLN